MTHQAPDNMDVAMWAAMYAAGALTQEERTAFEARLQAGDKDCIVEFKKLQPVIESLVSASPPVTPRPSVKDALLARIAAEQTSAPLPDTDVLNLRSNEGDWQETGVPGVRVRMLYIDKEANRQTFLVRMDPGTSYPSHPHPGFEECYVLEGDLHSAGRTMHIGDYQCAPAGSQHGVTSTKNGCLCLVTSAVA